MPSTNAKTKNPPVNKRTIATRRKHVAYLERALVFMAGVRAGLESECNG